MLVVARSNGGLWTRVLVLALVECLATSWSFRSTPTSMLEPELFGVPGTVTCKVGDVEAGWRSGFPSSVTLDIAASLCGGSSVETLALASFRRLSSRCSASSCALDAAVLLG